MSLFVYFLSTTVSYLSIAIYLSLQLYAIVNFLSAFLFDIVASLFVRPSPVFVDLSTLQAWFLSATFL